MLISITSVKKPSSGTLWQYGEEEISRKTNKTEATFVLFG